MILPAIPPLGILFKNNNKFGESRSTEPRRKHGKARSLETKKFYNEKLSKQPPTKFQRFKLKVTQFLLNHFRFLYRNQRIVAINKFHKEFWSKHKAVMPRKVK